MAKAYGQQNSKNVKSFVFHSHNFLNFDTTQAQQRATQVFTDIVGG